jgi:RNA polymerase sigma factor (sigma-70 family)
MNIFTKEYQVDYTDNELIQSVLGGDKIALTTLVEKHQPFIYNLAWKLTGNIADAEDLTQETLVKIITNLSTFKQQSSFTTWAYRIAKNQFLNDKNKSSNLFSSSFEELGNRLDNAPNIDLTQDEINEKKDLIKELRLQCLAGMLLCLTKEQRMIYIIGEIFGADHTVGSEIMEITKDNYRMKLSKARKELYNFMQNKCGLVDKRNPCRCHKKITFVMETGLINAKNLLHNRTEYSTFKSQIEPDSNFLAEEIELKAITLQRENSFKTTFEKKDFLLKLLETNTWQNGFKLN